VQTSPPKAMARRVLLLGGVLSAVLYVIGIDVIAALRYPDYHDYAGQTVSELFAAGAPTRTLMVWLMIPYNLLVFGLAVGVWASAAGTRAARFTAAAIAGYGAISTAGLLLFQMDVRGTVGSQRDPAHIVATMVMSILIVAMIAFGAFARGMRFRVYSFATIATVVVFGAWAGFLARPMPQATPWLGIAERVNIYATMLWVAVLAVSFLRVHGCADISRCLQQARCVSDPEIFR
jgi:Protein of unknown function (DUF998)